MKVHQLLPLLALFFLPLLGLGQVQPTAPSFDETKSFAKQYKDVMAIDSSLSPARRQEILEQTTKLTGGISAIYHMPFVINGRENETLQKGVFQISNAIRLFFEDHFSGKHTYIGNDVIPSEVIACILADYDSYPLNRLIPQGSTALIVGPDIVRTAEGFQLLEVIVAGWMGGLSTMSLLNDALQSAAPEYQKLFAGAPHASQFYDDLARYYQSELSRGEIGIIISSQPNNAFERKMQEKGFLVVSPIFIPIFRENGKIKLKTNDGIKTVGIVHLDIEASTILRTEGGKELVEAYFDEKVKLSTPPHADILMDKRLLPFIGRMIEFYLHEKPLILPPESKIISAKDFDALLPTIENYVIKLGVGRGGQQVFLGSAIAKDPVLAEQVRAFLAFNGGSQGIVQRMAIIGERDGMQTDIRPITYVDSKVTITTPVPWSRSNIVGEKSNVTGNFGKSTQNAVLVLPLTCDEIFLP